MTAKNTKRITMRLQAATAGTSMASTFTVKSQNASDANLANNHVGILATVKVRSPGTVSPKLHVSTTLCGNIFKQVRERTTGRSSC